MLLNRNTTNEDIHLYTILDGAAIVNILQPQGSKAFQDYANYIFLPYITAQFHSITRLVIVWDRYVCDSLKAEACSKREKELGDVLCHTLQFLETGLHFFELMTINQSCSYTWQQ